MRFLQETTRTRLNKISELNNIKLEMSSTVTKRALSNITNTKYHVWQHFQTPHLTNRFRNAFHSFHFPMNNVQNKFTIGLLPPACHPLMNNFQIKFAIGLLPHSFSSLQSGQLSILGSVKEWQSKDLVSSL